MGCIDIGNIKDKLKKLKYVKKGKEIYDTLKTVNDSSETMAGMSLMKFLNQIKKNPKLTLQKMSDEELDTVFNHEDIKKLFKVMPKLKKYYEQELKNRNI